MMIDEVEATAVYPDKSFGRRIDNGEIPNRINNALNIANDVVNHLLGRGFHDKLNPEFEALLLSLMCLIETLGNSRDNWDIFPNHYNNVGWRPETSPLLKNLLLRAGWCDHGIRWLHNRCSYISMLYFTTFFDLRILARDHQKCQNSDFCLVEATDEDAYVTRHIEDCECQHIGTDVGEDIIKILEKGEIPVLSVLSSSSQVNLTVKSAADVETYVAISHVWSDGLGNPHANSLPLCQLLQIQERVNNLYPKRREQPWFWIDTICVPLIRQFRNLAIRRMADVYQNANLVLVLDSSLLTSTINASNAEILARIKCSSWSRRLWTFQEGTLARGFRSVFQFQDGHFQVQQEFSRLVSDKAFIATAKSVIEMDSQNEQEGTTSRILRAIACFGGIPEEFRSSIEERYPEFPTSTDFLIFEWLWRCGGTTGDLLLMDGWTTYRELTESSQRRDISRLGQGLKNRQTSKPEDESICLGTLLGIDIEPMLNKSSEGRMKYLFQSVDRIRPAIVFSDGPRIEEDGFRWAPLSFLRPEMHPREPGFHPGRGMYAERHDRGLLVNFDGFLLPEPPVSNIFTITAKGQNYTVQLQPSIRLCQNDRMAIIHELRLSELEDKNFPTKAILVEITQIQEGIQFTLFSGVGSIVRAMDYSGEVIKVLNTTGSRWCVG